MSRSRPLRPSDLDLIRLSFKPQYFVPVQDWLLIQTDLKREQLYTFLRNTPSSHFRTIPSPHPLRRSLDLVIRTPMTAIDFNRSIHGPLHWQNDFRHHQPTSIATEGIFGFPTPLQKPNEHRKYSEHILLTLLQTQIAEKLFPLADDYFELFQEILKWTEKKTMSYPIDPMKEIPLLQPKTTGMLLKAQFEEDHFYEPGHQEIRKTGIVSDLRPQRKVINSSVYRETLCDDLHEDYLRSGPPPITQSLKGIDGGCPFGLFPIVEEKGNESLPELWKPTRENRREGLTNKRVHETETCL
jgi:hypothetical protein